MASQLEADLKNLEKQLVKRIRQFADLQPKLELRAAGRLLLNLGFDSRLRVNSPFEGGGLNLT
jgi:hypothetical protein